MSEATVADEVDEVEDTGYRDRRSLEAELQAIVRAKDSVPSSSPSFWAKRRRKK
jgi:hypothetical protein